MKAASLVLAVVLGACVDGAGDGPADIAWDRDACEQCGMVLSDRHFPAEIRGGPRSGLHKFDDVGCAVQWLERQSWASEPATKVWVARSTDGAWTDARTARYQGGKASPMGFGFAAADGPSSIDFTELRRQVLAMDRARPH